MANHTANSPCMKDRVSAMLVVRDSAIHGLGVFAQRDYAVGELIVWIDDSRVVDDDRPVLPGELAHHCDYLEAGRVVLMQEPERHINSSCDPSTYVRTVGDKCCVVARQEIHSGDEITYDYIIDCHGGRVWQCRCGSSRCRCTIVASFFDLPVSWQFEYLPLLNPWFVKEHDVRIQQLKRLLLDP